MSPAKVAVLWPACVTKGQTQGLPAPAAWTLQEEGGSWEQDPLVLDERYVAVRVKGRGAVVLSACSHAGAPKGWRTVHQTR